MNYNKYKISIIIPVYNPNIALLKAALKSCVEQTLKEIEIIIVDDKSTIEYKSKINEFLLKENIYFINTNHYSDKKGAGFARNIGLNEAKGEYIQFLDSDDLLYSNKTLEKLYNTAIETKENIIAGIPFQIENNQQTQLIWSFKNYKKLFQNKIANYKENQICYGFWSFLYNREFLIKNNLYFPNLKRFQDPIWLFKVLHTSKTFYATNINHYIHRIHTVLNLNWDKEKLQDYFKGLNFLVKTTNKKEYYDLHTYLYRKSFFWEYSLIQNIKDKYNIDFNNEFKAVLKNFNFEIIKKIYPTLPILKTLEDFNKTDFSKLKEFNY